MSSLKSINATVTKIFLFAVLASTSAITVAPDAHAMHWFTSKSRHKATISKLPPDQAESRIADNLQRHLAGILKSRYESNKLRQQIILKTDTQNKQKELAQAKQTEELLQEADQKLAQAKQTEEKFIKSMGGMSQQGLALLFKIASENLSPPNWLTFLGLYKKVGQPASVKFPLTNIPPELMGNITRNLPDQEKGTLLNSMSRKFQEEWAYSTEFMSIDYHTPKLQQRLPHIQNLQITAVGNYLLVHGDNSKLLLVTSDDTIKILLDTPTEIKAFGKWALVSNKSKLGIEQLWYIANQKRHNVMPLNNKLTISRIWQPHGLNSDQALIESRENNKTNPLEASHLYLFSRCTQDSCFVIQRFQKSENLDLRSGFYADKPISENQGEKDITILQFRSEQDVKDQVVQRTALEAIPVYTDSGGGLGVVITRQSPKSHQYIAEYLDSNKQTILVTSKLPLTIKPQIVGKSYMERPTGVSISEDGQPTWNVVFEKSGSGLFIESWLPKITLQHVQN